MMLPGSRVQRGIWFALVTAFSVAAGNPVVHWEGRTEKEIEVTVLGAMKLYRPRRVYLLRSEWPSLLLSLSLPRPNNVRRKVRAKCPFL